MNTQISRSQVLLTLPPRKIQDALEDTLKQCPACSQNDTKLNNCCNNCRVVNSALRRYAESNIPVKYWKIEMERDFKGDIALLEHYREIAKDVKDVYNRGVCLCFAGNNGTGKTMTSCNILKRAVEKGYNALYTTLNDIVNNLISSGTYEDRQVARRELLMIDFLVIDEFDPRYMGSDNAADLFGRTLEDIFRTRTQNCLPTFMCTNSPNVLDSFSGSIKQSIASLMNYATMVPVLGKDFRKESKLVKKG